MLHKEAPLEFLRTHRLNGSEALVLKKTNQKTLQAAYEAWIKIKSEGGGDAAGDGGGGGKIQQTFSSVLKKAMRGSPSNRVAVLLLHEDYPHELPVYHLNNRNAEAGNPGSEGEFDRVICVIGAVRDATQEEERAVIAAAKQLGIRVIGANLGRVAEFTSKIIASLSAHAACRQLGPSLSELLRLSGECDGASSLVKLPPARAGGWTWDGNSNKMIQDRIPIEAKVFVGSLPPRITDGSLRKLFSKYGEICRHGQDIHMMPPGASGMLCAFVKMANTAQATAAVEAINEKFKFAEEDDHPVTAQTRFEEKAPKATVGDTEAKEGKVGKASFAPHDEDDAASKESQLHLHFVAWLPFPASQLTPDVARRNEMHIAVALVVNALWRSRLGSEAQAGEEAMGKGPVIPELTLVFSDAVFLKVTQHSLAVSMASRHQAAPSEFQVLTTLVALLEERGNRQASTEGGGMIGALSRVVEYASKAKGEHKGLRILQLSHLPSHEAELPSLSSLSYDTRVVLDPEGLLEGERHRYMCLLETPHTREEVNQVVADTILGGEGCEIVAASLAGGSMSCSPGATLALVQHWAYNRRFVPAMARLIRDAGSGKASAPTVRGGEKVKKRKDRQVVVAGGTMSEEGGGTGGESGEPANKKKKSFSKKEIREFMRKQREEQESAANSKD